MRTLLILIIAVAMTQAAVADVVLNPTDDTMIGWNGHGLNWDENPEGIIVSSVAVGPPTYEKFSKAFFRFDLSQLIGTITDYEFRVYVNGADNWTSVTWRFAFPDTSYTGFGDDWNGSDPGIGDETTLTHDNAPAGLVPKIQFSNYENILSLPGWSTTKHASQADQDVFFNAVILPAYTGDKIATLVVYASGLTQVATITDREGNPGNTFYPELILKGVTVIPEPASMTVLGALAALLLRKKK